MFDRYEIEEIILGMAKIVHENRMLRNELEEMSLSRAKYEALSHGKHREYEVLADIEMHNASVSSCHSNGWLTNQDYIDDWEEEFERRMKNDQIRNP